MAGMNEQFQRELLKLGFISYSEQDTLWSIAKRCAAIAGLPLGVAIGVASAKGGTVVVPGVGTISAGLAGFLAGLTSGTAMCTAANLSYRNEMRRLLQ
ncbi:hypothetical protein [Pseudorhodoferax sp. Leaf267]|uniref:hypothetical protein n=1 Tax=Pseudorhodoferax sp. Leaf267 TaxID=1736316 RepID=UPI0006F62CF9|nr:hypothetical protein [Pseudorhodoferax sp. Leaf267]KQP21966.1 hypothetical protein ASF43_24240 [Pseudorhodoferax sp. Leaf267]